MALGGIRPLDGTGQTRTYELAPDDLVTHGIVVGGTGSGETGLLMVMVEEAVLSNIPGLRVSQRLYPLLG